MDTKDNDVTLRRIRVLYQRDRVVHMIIKE